MKYAEEPHFLVGLSLRRADDLVTNISKIIKFRSWIVLPNRGKLKTVELIDVHSYNILTGCWNNVFPFIRKQVLRPLVGVD